MRPTRFLPAALLMLVGTIAGAANQGGQPPPPGGGSPGQGGRGRGRGATFPAQQRPPADPALIARGKGLYDISCRACHGADLRGGDIGGPNLLRSQITLNDQDGELLLPIVQNGRQSPGMPPMPPLGLPADDVKAIAAYIRSVLASARGQGAPPEGPPVTLNVLVGDASGGQAYFAAKCARCHSAAGDLAGIGARIPDPMQLQNFWVSGGGGGRGGRGFGAPPPSPNAKPRDVTAVVTQPTGEKFEGRLLRIDDFVIVLGQPDGSSRSFRRDGDVPRVEIRDPLAPHKELLLQYTDKDIHDVTAYLVTLK